MKLKFRHYGHLIETVKMFLLRKEILFCSADRENYLLLCCKTILFVWLILITWGIWGPESRGHNISRTRIMNFQRKKINIKIAHFLQSLKLEVWCRMPSKAMNSRGVGMVENISNHLFLYLDAVVDARCYLSRKYL